MERPIKQLPGGSFIVGRLPEGCKFCAKGSKMVLFVTGLCDSACFYCPISSEKAGKDVIFADEMPVHSLEEIVHEADAIGSEGVGISGGDPLCTLDRTISHLSMLKTRYGDKYHSHLYTSVTSVNQDTLEKLVEAGLDEIRFHPQRSDWTGIERAMALGMTVGIEVPAIPGKIEKLTNYAKRAEELDISFMNINELEASETNFSQLSALGMRLSSLEESSIEGSRETALELLDYASKHLDRLSVHFCSARYKDSIQMRNRLERRLKRTIRPFEERDDDDPLLILGVIRAPHGNVLDSEQLEHVFQVLSDEFDVPNEMMNIDSQRMRIEIAAWILDEIALELQNSIDSGLPIEMGIAFEYPSWDRLQTLFNPL